MVFLYYRSIISRDEKLVIRQLLETLTRQAPCLAALWLGRNSKLDNAIKMQLLHMAAKKHGWKAYGSIGTPLRQGMGFGRVIYELDEFH